MFQKLYDWFKNIKTPIWWKDLMADLQVVLISILTQVAKGFIESLQEKIIEISQKPLTNKEKFEEVFKYAKFLLPTLKDSYVNLLIEVLVNRLKTNKTL